jgi:hypothetical protein
VGGYFVINAENIDEAAKIATDCPGFDYGAKVQVRPVMKM